MKISIVALLFIPLLSFAQEDVTTQLSKKEKRSIDNYTMGMCDCVNNVMSELHPKTLEVIELMADEGQGVAMGKLEEIIGDLDTDEQQAFLASLEKMNDPEFIGKIDECDRTNTIEEELKTKIDSLEGAEYDYMLAILNREESCKLVKVLIDLGDTPDE